VNPFQALLMLDQQLARHGHKIALRRGATGPVYEMRAFVRGYEIEKVVGLVTLADRKVIVSPTGLGAFGMPRANDDFAMDGLLAKVQEAQPIHLHDVLVRVEMRVRFA
jgi:hypothetical protein